MMGAIASQITSLTIVYSTVCSDADQRKHQSSASLAFVQGIHRGPVNSPHKWPVKREMFPFDDVIMTIFETSRDLVRRHLTALVNKGPGFWRVDISDQRKKLIHHTRHAVCDPNPSFLPLIIPQTKFMYNLLRNEGQSKVSWTEAPGIITNLQSLILRLQMS